MKSNHLCLDVVLEQVQVYDQGPARDKSVFVDSAKPLIAAAAAAAAAALWSLFKGRETKN